MKIIQIIQEKRLHPQTAPSPTIVFFGDSVTQGCFEIYNDENGVIQTTYDRTAVYHSRINEILSCLYPSVPVQIINSGISGDNTKGGLARLQRDVLSFSPDLVIVCFGLNDSGNGMKGVECYRNNLKSIFRKIMDTGCEVIYMTPNMMNTYISHRIRSENIRRVAEKCMACQNDGVFDAYINAGIGAAAECGCRICDVYAKWKLMNACGVDTTALLCNDINHPSKEMHWLFAHALLDVFFEQETGNRKTSNGKEIWE